MAKRKKDESNFQDELIKDVITDLDLKSLGIDINYDGILGNRKEHKNPEHYNIDNYVYDGDDGIDFDDMKSENQPKKKASKKKTKNNKGPDKENVAIDKEKNKNEVVIIKPNTFSASTSNTLSTNATKILLFSMYKIQKDANTVTFTKKEIDDFYLANFGTGKEIKKHMTELMHFGMKVEDEEKEKILMVNAFSYIKYDNGVFEFSFNERFLPAIDSQKRFLQYRMGSIMWFKSKYTIYLYDFLKDAMYRNSTIANLGNIEFKKIFLLKETDYEKSNTNFRMRVWEPAMNEINKFTEYKLEIKTSGRGNAIKYTLILHQREMPLKRNLNESDKGFECKLGKNMIDCNCRNCMRINKCTYGINDEAWDDLDKKQWFSYEGYKYFMDKTFWGNTYYNLIDRMDNHVAQACEYEYYDKLLNTIEVQERLLANEKIRDIVNSERIAYQNFKREQAWKNQGTE